MTNKQKSFRRWVEGAIVYQIYPRSFYDSNGDGIGDIPGVTKKLDYLKDLGVNAIWLSPFFPSPMADFGYDVADYCDVDPIFGTLADCDKMVAGAHRRGIKVMVDLVPNHTSDDHEWFRQSRQSREGKYSDWYIWHDPKGYDENKKPIPPNNWIEVLTGGSAWQWEPARRQFYLHSFDVRQPDLNWPNPAVREAIKDAMRFWLDRDVDGFRVDAVHFMAKDPLFKNEPENPHYDGHGMRYARLEHPYNHGWPPMYVYLAEMAAVLKEPKYQNSDRFMVTEAYPDNFHNPIPEYLTFYQGMDPEVAAPFNFEGLQLPWSAPAWHKFLQNFHSALDAFSPLCIPSYAFGNHDQHRIVSRRGPEAARAAAVLLLTLPGMVFIYNGDEIGMKNGHIPKQFIQDPGAKGGSGRDPERTPLQWSAAKNAGFTTAQTPWLPIADDYATVNIQTELKDPDSFLSLYKTLTKLRNKSDALKFGGIRVINTSNPAVLGYIRVRGREQYTVLINFFDGRRTVNLKASPGKFILSSDPETDVKTTKDTKFHLRPREAVLFVNKSD